MSERSYKTTGDDLLSGEGRVIAYRVVGGRCPICRAKMVNSGACKRTGMTLDHVTAHANGGGAEGNLAPLCGSCNSSKRDRDLADWLPGRLVATKRARTLTGARRMAGRVVADVETVRDTLTAALVDAGVWSAEAVA